MKRRYLCLLFAFIFNIGNSISQVQVPKSVVRKGTQKVTKAITKVVTKKTAKVATKKAAELSVKDLPKGRKTLEVIRQKDGSYLPAINNLNKHSSNYAKIVNETLLKRRRAAISPYDQFATMSQLKTYDRKKLIITDKPSAAVLRKNMELAMDQKSVNISRAFGGTAAHHVIEGSDKAALKSRDILKKFDIDINAAENGIFLPDGPNSIYKGSRHITSHTEAYSNYVYNKIKDSKSKSDLISSLMEIKHELYSGKLNLQGPAQIVNKNIH